VCSEFPAEGDPYEKVGWLVQLRMARSGSRTPR
jgi:hypothetical protein